MSMHRHGHPRHQPPVLSTPSNATPSAPPQPQGGMPSHQHDALAQRRAQTYATIERGIRLFNERQFNGYLDDYAPDFQLTAEGLPHPLGREESLEYLVGFAKIFPGILLTPLEILVDATGDAAMYRFRADAHGTDGFMGLPPTQGKIVFEGAVTYRLRDGLRVSSWMVWDNGFILQQLGVLPQSFAPGTTAAAARNATLQAAAALGPTASMQAAPSPMVGRPLGAPETPAPLCDFTPPPRVEVIEAAGIERVVFEPGALRATASLTLADGHQLGNYQVVYRETGLPRQALLQPPPNPPGPMDRPNGIVGPPVFSSWTWVLDTDEGSQVVAVGLSTARLVPLRGGQWAFLISAMGVVAGGTGRYTNASGVLNESGGVVIPGHEALAPGSVLEPVPTQLSLVLVGDARITEPRITEPATPPQAPDPHAMHPPLPHLASMERATPHGGGPIEILTGAGVETAEVHQGQGQNFLVARAKLFDRQCQPMGSYVGTLLLRRPLGPSTLLQRPPVPPVRDGRPTAGEPLQPIGDLKVTFTFNPTDSVTVVASATALLSPLADGSTAFMITAFGQITGGTGRFEGATGVETETGLSIIPPGHDLSPGSAPLPFRTTFVMHLVLRGQQGQMTLEAPASPHSLSPAPKPGYQAPSAQGSPVHSPPKPHLAHRNTSAMESETENDDIATFLLVNKSIPIDPKADVPIMHGDQIIGGVNKFELHSFTSAHQALTVHGLKVANPLSAKAAGHMEMEWRLVPEDFVVRMGTVAPPTAFSFTSSVRFMGTCDLRFFDRHKSRLRLFGEGATHPINLGDQEIITYSGFFVPTHGTGQFKGTTDLVILNGIHQPPSLVSTSLMVQAQSKNNPLLSMSHLAPVQGAEGGFPAVTLCFVGQEDPSVPTQRDFSVLGQLRGATLSNLLRTAETTSGVQPDGELEAKTVLHASAGHLSGVLEFDVLSQPPELLRGRDFRFSFSDSAGRQLGTFGVDQNIGPAGPPMLPKPLSNTLQSAVHGEVIHGTGIFHGAKGLVTTAVWLQINPWKLSSYVMVRLFDPDGRFRAQTPNTHPVKPTHPYGGT